MDSGVPRTIRVREQDLPMYANVVLQVWLLESFLAESKESM